jgi:pyruvate dehydrogenase E2 component (dihydrolipoamide acetyltransferase)
VRQEFTLPDVGEGLTEGEILKWRVKPGDVITVNQVLVEVETAKAAVELPSPWAGTIVSVHGNEGEVLDVGSLLVVLEDGVGDIVSHEPATPFEATSDATTTVSTGEAKPARTAVLVGYGVKEDDAAPVRKRRVAGPDGEAAKPVRHGGLEVGRLTEARFAGGASVLAKPPVRHLARDLGVDLRGVTPTGPGGTVSREDVIRAAATRPDGEVVVGHAHPQHAPEPAHDEVIALRGVQRMMAESMTRSASIPQATEWLEVDVTRTMSFVKRLAERREFRDVKVSPLLIASYAVIRAVQGEPLAQARYNEDGTLLVRGSVNLGIAVDSPRGLLVPHVADAQNLGLLALAKELNRIVDDARHGKSSPAELMGATVSLTNIGPLGIDAGAPVLPPDQTIIVALGKIAQRPAVHKGKLAVRWTCTLSASFDHRVLDGAQGARVLADIAAVMNDPAVALVE